MGIVHVKQVFSIPPAQRAHTKLASIAQPVPVVPSTLDGDAVMAQILASTLQTALVADEYGGIAGMVTGEDLIEEIVGDVRDEHDDVSPDVVRTGNDWVVSGLLRIDEVDTETPFRAHHGEYETIGGLVLQELGHIPEEGESVELTRVRPGLAERRAGAVAGDRRAHGRPPHRPDQAGPSSSADEEAGR